MQEGRVNVVKLKGPHAALVRELVGCGIPVMGHLGYTPQSVHSFGGPRVQGRLPEAAEALVKSALELQEAGACSLVLEAVPTAVAKRVTESLSTPTIGIGAGPFCDGQVLVISDLLGLGTRNLKRVPRFVKQYANLDTTIADAVSRFLQEVKVGSFPDAGHSYN